MRHALLRRHENLEELVNDIFLDGLEMYPKGREGLEDCIDGGFKTRDQIRHERNESSRNEKKGEIVP
jgi:hypothetical protein